MNAIERVVNEPEAKPENEEVEIKGQMNPKFDIFYFSSILVKYV